MVDILLEMEEKSKRTNVKTDGVTAYISAVLFSSTAVAGEAGNGE